MSGGLIQTKEVTIKGLDVGKQSKSAVPDPDLGVATGWARGC
jgi:hypothetical protein